MHARLSTFPGGRLCSKQGSQGLGVHGCLREHDIVNLVSVAGISVPAQCIKATSTLGDGPRCSETSPLHQAALFSPRIDMADFLFQASKVKLGGGLTWSIWQEPSKYI